MVERSSSNGYYSSLLSSIESKAFNNIGLEDKSTWKNLTFPDATSTYNFYKSYATQAGFVVRKHWRSCKDSSKKKIDIPFYFHYSCSKRGFTKGSASNPSNDFEVDYVEVVVVVVNVEAGIPNRPSFELFSRMANSVEKVGFRPIDLKNFLFTVRHLKLEDGEGSCLLEYFGLELLNKANYFYSVQFDSEEQVASIFWSDGIMRSDYPCFGDVFSFDTIFWTNNLYRPLGSFIGFNHHRQIYQCQAIRATVLSVMPSSVFHGLSSWNINENAKRNLGRYADTNSNEPSVEQKYQQVCLYMNGIASRVCIFNEPYNVFLNDIMEAGKRAELFIQSLVPISISEASSTSKAPPIVKARIVVKAASSRKKEKRFKSLVERHQAKKQASWKKQLERSDSLNEVQSNLLELSSSGNSAH
ncbi:hypothetical protein LIER_35401 [Lithospermum erythrorhizon]|uniref:Protein FAR1-RELATED SEQUENCE n=1 Tax=Lithospermum erythrorhizon TaxID=34254 RepID=A0AAV3NQ37_LITER